MPYISIQMLAQRIIKRPRIARIVAAFVAGLGLAMSAALAQNRPAKLEFIQICSDRQNFVLAHSHSRFTPWGFNYDHDASGRLLETYWHDEWPAVVRHFSEMKALGANVVRIHLQLGEFMKSPRQPNAESLAQLKKLVSLAESNSLYLDITGLGCYDRAEVPQWYTDLDEGPRWDVQARFWEAVAATCHDSPAVFCYDLMNEPVVVEDKKGRDWTPGEFDGRFFVQRLTLNFAGRTPEQIARAWVDKMAAAIRRHDRHRLLTVGAIPWALTWPGAKPIFYSKKVGKHLDFVSVHFYPKAGEVDKALTALAVYQVGKPLVIEEMFPLNCSVEEMDQFIKGSKPVATGWITFYWGKTIAAYHKDSSKPYEATPLKWLEYFVNKTPDILGTNSVGGSSVRGKSGTFNDNW